MFFKNDLDFTNISLKETKKHIYKAFLNGFSPITIRFYLNIITTMYTKFIR